MTAPEVDVLLSSGDRVLLRSLYEERPLALVFLRHFGCTFCREHVNDLRGETELNLAFVSMADRVESEAFQRKMQVTHPFICDPEARLYALFGLKRASIGEVFNPRVFMRGVQAVGKGNGVGRPVGNPWQLPGTFILNAKGDVVHAHRSRDAADNLSAAEIRKYLAEAAEVEHARS